MSTLRVGFDARYISDRYHGIGRFAFRILEEMSQLAPEITWVVFRGQDQDTRFQWADLSARPNVELRKGPWPLFWPHEHLQWPLLLSATGVDLFHSPYLSAPWLRIPLISSRKIPFLFTIHDLIFERFPEYMPQRYLRPYYQLMVSQALRQASRVITVSDATARDLRRFYQVSESKIAIIPEGVDPHFQTPPSQQILTTVRNHFNLHQPFVLNVGARRPHKNQALLVRTFTRVAGDIPHDLVLAGPADPRFPDDSQQAARESGLNGRIRFLDWVPEEYLPALYRLADLVVLPSEIEGFGLPALEAMASGTIVLGSNRSAFPEVIGPGGICLDPGDEERFAREMKSLLLDHERRQQLGIAAINQAQHFTWKNSAQEILRLYRQVVP